MTTRPSRCLGLLLFCAAALSSTSPRPCKASAAGGPLPSEPPAASPPAPVGISYEGMEVVQSIQDMTHRVPLVAGKRTVVRLYFGTNSQCPVTVRGELSLRLKAPNSPWLTVSSMRDVVVRKAMTGKLRPKREDLTKSLNFLLPEAATTAGEWSLRLTELRSVNPGAILAIPSGAGRDVRFEPTPPLRVRILGLRYEGEHGTVHAPSGKDFAMIRSWLTRAYPVAELTWSQAVVDVSARPADADISNAVIRAFRKHDLAGGADRRTHYYGLVDDGGGFMDGLASGQPYGAPDLDVVASGPTGSSAFAWDEDGSYGDWYTAHELGHTLGRPHAVFCGANDEGYSYPHPDGRISPADGSVVGLDMGDVANGLPMRALPGTKWSDVMTYCPWMWLSDVNYIRIRNRLIEEDAMGPGPPVPVPPVSPGGILVIARVNRTKASAQIDFVTPVPTEPDPERSSPFTLRLLGADGATLSERPAAYYPSSCLRPEQDETGVIEATIPQVPGAAAVALLEDEKVLDELRVGPVPEPMRLPVSAKRDGPVEELPPPGAPRIVWDHASPLPLDLTAPVDGGDAPAGITYVVQRSVDGGVTWLTVGMGLKRREVTLDRADLGAATQVMIRVTATNGFRTETTERSFSIDEL